MSTRIYCDQCGTETSKREALRFSLSGYSANRTSMGQLNDIEIDICPDCAHRHRPHTPRPPRQAQPLPARIPAHRPERRPSMTSIITNEIEERYPYPDNGERPTGITRLGQCLASRKAYRAGVCRKITDREIDAAALAVYMGASGMGFEEVEPLRSKSNPDAKEQYRLLARLAITAARTEALK